MADEKPIAVKATCPAHGEIHVLLHDTVVHVYHEPRGEWVGHIHFRCPTCIKSGIPDPEYTLELTEGLLDMLVDHNAFVQQLGPDGKVVTGKDLMQRAIVDEAQKARADAQPYKIEPHPEGPPADLPPITVDDYIDFMLDLDDNLQALLS